MRSKWEFIRDQLYAINENELAKMADEIEKSLQTIYGETITKSWGYVKEISKLCTNTTNLIYSRN